MDTAFDSFLLFEQIERNVAKHCQIFRSVVFTYTAMIFFQRGSKTQYKSFLIDQCLRTAFLFGMAG
jgi:hypothetical protein